MSGVEFTVNSLEIKINKLLRQMSSLKQDNLILKQNLQLTKEQLKNKQEEVINWKNQFETLKIANAMLGSDDNKRETKLKINALIREIDHCIGQLSE
ncbi:hypothetical protein [Aurantibacter sp.]|uniref:hypothetical protein n=1 Tax=Aurantibacter sp. TaxID=2807103 RepID=UPI0035C86AE1